MKNKFPLLFLVIFFALLSFTGQSQIFDHLTVTTSDSLVNANYYNPNFVILDVRTPGEYNPEHLEDAININFFDIDFNDQLDQLNKEKRYLIHCKSGNRSGQTMSIMETLGFQEVYNMLGGIQAWNNESLPTTDGFAPRFMFVSDSIFPLDTVSLMALDTLKIKITNRGNSLLSFEAASSLAENDEFSTDFDLGIQLWGAQDYTFDIVYAPQDELVDSLEFLMVSNTGNHLVNIIRVGQGQTVFLTDPSSIEELKVFPNPVDDKLYFENYDPTGIKIEVLTVDGRKVLETQASALDYIDVSKLEAGIYFFRFSKGISVKTHKVLINR